MIAATWLGVGAGVWFALALVGMAWPRHRAAATRAILALAVTLGVNDQIVKPLVDRARPFEQARDRRARRSSSRVRLRRRFRPGTAATAVVGAVSLARARGRGRAGRWACSAR